MKRKIIRDSIYTYIEIEENVRDIIDSISFQRLKNIKQLTIQHLYPSANHTRFEHSLGVMHLALQIFEKIKEQLLSNQEGNSSLYFNEYFLKDHLLYAALLHDVGHAPFSHVGEKLYERKEILAEIKKEIWSIKNKYIISLNIFNSEKIAPHELMSCYVLIRNFIDKLIPFNFKPKGEKIILDLEFILRIICGSKYLSSDDPDINVRKIKNTIISIVNSETIDADKIDYLLRDNKIIGYIGPRLDVNRLIMSATVNSSEGLSFTTMGISALQGLIDCRDILYLWVFNHHTVVYTDYLYQKCFVQFTKLHKPGNEWMPRKNFFSPKAIADDNVSDIDVLFMMNKAYKLVEKDATFSKYTSRLIDQFRNRQFLKPLWKTLNQYNDFLDKCGYKNEKEKKEVNDYINNWKNRMRLVHSISNNLKIERGNLFIVKRENKFCEEILEKLIITDNDIQKTLGKLLPTKDSKSKYQDTAFYVYCKKDQIEYVKKELEYQLININRSQNYFNFY